MTLNLKKTLFAAAVALAATSVNAATELTVYTALEADQLKSYTKGFETANPDVKIRWVRDSTGIITARLLAEKENPQADAILGVAATSLGTSKNLPHSTGSPVIASSNH